MKCYENVFQMSTLVILKPLLRENDKLKMNTNLFIRLSTITVNGFLCLLKLVVIVMNSMSSFFFFWRGFNSLGSVKIFDTLEQSEKCHVV